MDRRAEQRGDFASAFEAAFARLQVQLETACMGDAPWPERVSGAIRRALELAVADPAAASVLVNQAPAQGRDGIERYERLMTYLAGLLETGRADSSHVPDLPPTTERSLAGGVVAIVADRVDRGRMDELPGLTVELVQFVLTPYIGAEEARRAAAFDWPGSQPDR